MVLLLDACGERASVAVARAEGVLLAEQELGAREASAGLVNAIQSVLGQAGFGLDDLAGIGVVNGPGSFTGVRVALALAKGLCEAAQLPMAAVSRLEVLAESAPAATICLVSAGRDQVYARLAHAGEISEGMLRDREVQDLRGGAPVIADSAELAARLAEGGPVKHVLISAFHALGPVLRRFAAGGSDVALTDANYVRNEDAIYRKATAIPATVQGQ